jgi:hypothetical protein
MYVKTLITNIQYRRATVGTKALVCSSTCDHQAYLLYLVVLRGKFEFRLKNRINHIIFYTKMVEEYKNSILFYSILCGDDSSPIKNISTQFSSF